MKEKEEVAKTKPTGKADKVLATQRRLEERQRQQMILEEMKKPTEDMCLTDHQVVRGEEQVLEGPPMKTLLLQEEPPRYPDCCLPVCLTEHLPLLSLQPLPDFSRIPGLILPSGAFSDCLTIVEFLHSFGKVLGFDPAKDVPSLGVLQEGLLCQGDSLGEVQDLLVRLLKAALCDPGLPSYCQVRAFPGLRGLGSVLFSALLSLLC